MKTIYLPFFTGFYNTYHEYDYEYFIENVREDMNNKEGYSVLFTEEEMKETEYCEISDLFEKYYEIDNEKYEKEYTKLYYEEFVERYSEKLKEIGINILNYSGITSPKEYNFDTDHINISVEYEIDKIMKMLNGNKEIFTKYIKERNTSYDGYWANGTNQIDEYLGKDDFEAFELTQIIDFYIREILKEDQEDMSIDFSIYGEISGNIGVHEYIKERDLIDNK